METLSLPGNFQDLLKYKNQICAQYPDQSITVFDFTFDYPIIHYIDHNKSRMSYPSSDRNLTCMIGKNNQLMTWNAPIYCSKRVIITDDPILKRYEHIGGYYSCVFPTLWIKEAIELEIDISLLINRFNWDCSIDKSQHLLKGVGLSAKNFRSFYCTHTISLNTFKELLSIGYSGEFIQKHNTILKELSPELLNKESIEYVLKNRLTESSFSTYQYRDYIRMRNQLPSKVKKQFAKCPNLTKHTISEWHDRILQTYNVYRKEIELLQNQQKQSKYFAEIYPKAKEFEFKDDLYEIKCPEQVTLLLHEGRTLHHCVGSYIDSVTNGNEYILFLRKTSEPDIPFFTINVLPDNRVRQIHGLCNCNLPDELKPFIKKWANKFGLNISNCNGVYCHL